jgi:ParB family chromosome partitioning protein
VQNSSEFQYIAIDTIHESATNPRRTFDESKLGELAESIRTNGLIQPITVRPNSNGFEIVAGARRFRAAQLAELFSLPARIVDISDSETILWQLVENSQRVDVHPYEEAQGFQRLLDMPGYDVATLVEKSGKSPAHVYARLSLLQLIPTIAEAFSAERITASHANPISPSPPGCPGQRLRAVLA